MFASSSDGVATQLAAIFRGFAAAFASWSWCVPHDGPHDGPANCNCQALVAQAHPSVDEA